MSYLQPLFNDMQESFQILKDGPDVLWLLDLFLFRIKGPISMVNIRVSSSPLKFVKVRGKIYATTLRLTFCNACNQAREQNV